MNHAEPDPDNYDVDAGRQVMLELCTVILDQGDDGPLIAELTAAGTLLAQHVRCLDAAMLRAELPPKVWLTAQLMPRPAVTATAAKYDHGEAYGLMLYQADDGSGEQETVWNSRDGVTPFVITLRSGKTATHVNWSGDGHHPAYRPSPGDRVFADVTAEVARELAERKYAQFAADTQLAPKLDSHLGPKDQAIANLAAQYGQPGSPVLMYVHDDGSYHLDPAEGGK